MSDTTNAVLQRAHELIENDELEQAQALLAPLLETDDKNPALWWVYTHALRDQSIGQLALDRVLELDPSYPGANELKKDVLEVQARDPDFLQLDANEGPAAQEAAGGAVDDWDDLQPEIEASDESAGGRAGVVALAVILFIVAAGIALVASGAIDISEVLSGILPTPEAEVIVVSAPTDEPVATEPAVDEPASEVTPEVGAQATEAPTVAPTDEPTAEAPTAEATEAPALATTADTVAEPEATPTVDEASNPLSAFVRAVADSISEFAIDRRASAVSNTLLGRTIVIQVCAVPGAEFNARLSKVINTMVDLADSIPEETEAVAAGLLNCDDEDAALRVIGVSVEIIQQYLDEDIDSREFQRAWQPLS